MPTSKSVLSKSGRVLSWGAIAFSERLAQCDRYAIINETTGERSPSENCSS
ncbi:MAG TPA: hypothetical protein V6C90_07260 [Coleofasciculaceae cyanobacterium]